MKIQKSKHVYAMLNSVRKNVISETRRDTFFAILPWFCLVAAYLAAVLFHLIYGKQVLNSDMSGEIVLADLLNRSGDFVISQNWYYSTELRVLNQQLPLQLGLLLFPHNWHLARTFSLAVMLALHALAFLFLMRECGMKRGGVYCTAILMCPFGFWYLWYGTYGVFYLPHMIFVELNLALGLHIVKGKKHGGVFLALLLVLSFVEGLGGVRMLMNFYVPFCAAAVLVMFLRLQEGAVADCKEESGWFAGTELRLSIMAILSCAACLFGYVLNNRFLTRYYSFSSFQEQYWGELKLSGLLDVWSMFLSLFGYPYSDNLSFLPREETPLFSTTGILGAFGILLTGVIVYSSVRLLIRWKELDFVQLTVTILFWVCFAVDSIVYAWIYQNMDASYWLPIVPLAIAVLGIEIQTEHFRLPSLRLAMAVVLGFCVVCSSYSTICRFLASPAMTMPGIESVGEWLAENGWTQGYATFWNGNLVTELTDGEVEMWSVWDVYELELQPWLQSTAHDNPPEGQVFVLLNPYEGETLVELPYRQEEYVIYSDENGFVVLGFDSAEQLFALLGTDA